MTLPLVCPSLLAANFANLEESLEAINQSQADYLHMDIMDGVFVPNISFGTPVCKAVQKVCSKPLDYHLMIVNPDNYINQFVDLGAKFISVHYEVCNHLHRTVSSIKSQDVKAGVVLNPHTPVEVLTDILSEIDMVLLMSVNPGFGGQKFIENTYDKVERLAKIIEEKKLNVHIEIDGGVNQETAKQLVKSGANMLVAGSHVFNAKDPVKAIAELKSL